jgi:hypothetical protein
MVVVIEGTEKEPTATAAGMIATALESHTRTLATAGPSGEFTYARSWSLTRAPDSGMLRVDSTVIRVYTGETADAADDAETYDQLVGYQRALVGAGFTVDEVYEGWRTVALHVDASLASQQAEGLAPQKTQGLAPQKTQAEEKDELAGSPDAEPTDTAEPVGVAEPAEPAEAAEPVEPVGAAETAEPAKPAKAPKIPKAPKAAKAPKAPKKIKDQEKVGKAAKPEKPEQAGRDSEEGSDAEPVKRWGLFRRRGESEAAPAEPAPPTESAATATATAVLEPTA